MVTLNQLASDFLTASRSERSAETRLNSSRLARVCALAGLAAGWKEVPDTIELGKLAGLPAKIVREKTGGEALYKWRQRLAKDAKTIFAALEESTAKPLREGLKKADCAGSAQAVIEEIAHETMADGGQVLAFFAGYLDKGDNVPEEDKKETAKGKEKQGAGSGANSANAEAGETIAKEVNALLDSVLATAEEQLAAIAALALKAKDKQQAVKLFQAEALKLIQQGLTQ